MPDCQQHVVQPVNVQKGFLLAGEGSVGQIFRRRRRAHREGRFVTLSLDQCLVSRGDVRLQRERQRRFQDPLANFLAGHGKRRDILDIERRQRLLDSAGQAAGSQKLPVRLGGCGKPARDPHAGTSQLADHFTE